MYIKQSPNPNKLSNFLAFFRQRQSGLILAIAVIAVITVFTINGLSGDSVINDNPHSMAQLTDNNKAANNNIAISLPSSRPFIDGVDKRIHNELSSYVTWLQDNEATAVIGEFGWPNSNGLDGDKWDLIASQWLKDIEQTGIPTYYWASGTGWGEYPLAAHTASNGRITGGNSQDRILQDNRGANEGINVAGLEFGTQLSGFSNVSNEMVDTQYINNSTSVYADLARSGYRQIRLPFSWERIQPDLFGELDPVYFGYVRDAVQQAARNDQTMLLDLHNYGRYITLTGDSLLGSEELPHASLADVWKRISKGLNDIPTEVVEYGIMNEPHDLLSGSWGSSEKNWEAASQTVVKTLRSTGDKRKIVIAGYNWSKLSTWSQYHPSSWIQDPLNNFSYEAHHYWDHDTSGRYEGRYR